jgi:FAD/FMN-containing dehydrogenase
MAGTTRRGFLEIAGAAALGGLASACGLPATRIARDRPDGLVLPGDPDYAQARASYNARFALSPAAIAFCRTSADVRGALQRARELGHEVRARCGRHSYEAFSLVDGGLVVDVSPMREIRVDRGRGTARVGAGWTLGDLYAELWRHGVTIPAGTCPGVGICGLTLGGGIGFLTRELGLTCDALESTELVTAEGEVIRADRGTHADLFWALRGGGGGNFGIVTAFDFRVRPVAEVSVFRISWPWPAVEEVIDAWQRWAPVADERLTSSLEVGTARSRSLAALGQFTGAEGEAASLLTPLTRVGAKPVVTLRRVPFDEAVRGFAGPHAEPRSFKNTGSYVYDPLPPRAIAILADALTRSPGAANGLEFLALGGAAARVAPDATAYVHRKAAYLLQYQASWKRREELQENVRWANALRSALLPYTAGTYVNFVDTDIVDWPVAYYGENLARLARIRAKYDPRGVFRFPHAIPAA